MYRIDLDRDKKLVTIEVIGKFSKDEILSFHQQIEEILNQFGTKELMLLMLMERAEPVSQENYPLLVQLMKVHADSYKKIAKVHKRVITRLQVERMENDISKTEGNMPDSTIFYNKKDALRYLLS